MYFDSHDRQVVVGERVDVDSLDPVGGGAVDAGQPAAWCVQPAPGDGDAPDERVRRLRVDWRVVRVWCG